MTNSFLGTGWSFPPTFDNTSGTVNMVSDLEHIQQSLMILLQTEQGERLMQPEYGSELKALLFEPIDITFGSYLKDRIKDSILFNEHRIIVDDILITQDLSNELLMVEIQFTVQATNSRSNIVYPFYLNEGTNI